VWEIDEMKRRIALLPLTILAFLALTASASATVKVLDQDGGTVDTFTKGECRVFGKGNGQRFFAVLKSEQKLFSMTVFIDEGTWKGFGRDYALSYGVDDPAYFLRRRTDDELFSNVYPIPGTPPGAVGAGGIHFNGSGKRMGIGAYAASNKAFTDGYSFAGGVRCRYKKKGK
jgi:hypothetical protein